MNLTINGENKTIDAGVKTVQELLEKLNLNKNFIIVELDQNIISKELFEITFLKDKQKLELLKVVGGG